MVLDVNISEGPTGAFMLGAGYDSYNGIVNKLNNDSIQSEQRHIEEIQQAQNSYNGIIKNIYYDSIQFEKRHQEAIIQRDSLKVEIIKFTTSLEPFIELSKSKYPNYSIDEGLDKLVDELKNVKKKTERIVKVWLTTRFEGGRHKRRIRKISKIEKKYLGQL